jgi:hypothetical protein
MPRELLGSEAGDAWSCLRRRVLLLILSSWEKAPAPLGGQGLVALRHQIDRA